LLGHAVHFNEPLGRDLRENWRENGEF